MRTPPPATSTDLYQLSMAAGHWIQDRTAVATFELFTRRLPPDRTYLLAGGLEAAVEYLTSFHFTEAEIAYLRGIPALSSICSGFFDALASVRFTGDCWAVPEGTPIFPGEPILSVTAPILEAQIVETALLSIVNFPTSVSSKAARIVQSARGKAVIEFGARRAHGTEAALVAARSAFVGGCAGTSNVEAGMRFGLPLYGTLAHAWVMSFDDELAAFKAYRQAFPGNAVLLIDTYETLKAAKRITEAFDPGSIHGVRLDSGDIGALARAVREILDGAGFHSTRILASGDLNEYSIDELLTSGAPIDAFGVGTDLTTVRDAPSLGVVYKLVEMEEGGRIDYKMKFSDGKVTWPGRKQVWRVPDSQGEYSHDIVTLRDDPPPEDGALALLEPVILGGQRVIDFPPLDAIQAYARVAVSRLPEALRGLSAPMTPYPVKYSDSIIRIADGLRARQFGDPGGPS